MSAAFSTYRTASHRPTRVHGNGPAAGTGTLQAGPAIHQPDLDELVTQPMVDEFQAAMAAYKESSGRMFPTWSEVLEVLRSLGYKKPEAGA
jgi:hypothetical protein